MRGCGGVAERKMMGPVAVEIIYIYMYIYIYVYIYIYTTRLYMYTYLIWRFIQLLIWRSHILGTPHKNMMIVHSIVKRHQGGH